MARGGTPEKLGEGVRPIPKTLAPFMTKPCDFCYLFMISIPCLQLFITLGFIHKH